MTTTATKTVKGLLGTKHAQIERVAGAGGGTRQGNPWRIVALHIG